MESLIGRLNRAAHVITPDRYLLNQLQHLLKRGKKWGPQQFQYWHIQYLQLCINILQWVTDKVVPINNTIFTTPTVVLCSYTFKYGIRGYNDKIMAWRCHTPRQISWCSHAKPNGVPCLRSININYYPATGPWIPYPRIYG